MMDGDTMRKIMAINLRVAKKYGKKMIKTIDVFETERTMMEGFMRNPNIPMAKRDKLRKLLSGGIYDHKSSEINDAITKKIGDEVAAEIQHEIKMGRLKPPKMDAWMQKIQNLTKGS